jgi:hypothetical protein
MVDLKRKGKMTTMLEPKVEETAIEPKPRKERPPVIPTPRSEGVSGRKPIVMRFHVGKEFIRKFEIPQLDSRKKSTVVYHMYPLLSEWIGRTAPDGVNPRSHDPECLKSPVAKQIEQTILEKPEDFFLANRGSTLIADSVFFDGKTGDVEVCIIDPENQGLADGATTDAVIAKVQTQLAREFLENREASYIQLLDVKGGKIPEILKNGRVHLEVIENLDDRDRIANLVQGRNTSRQVRGWSMADFKGVFDWIKDILENDDEFKNKVGYEENSPKDVSILDIISLITLFHPEFDEKDEAGTDKAPTVAYANKGRMDSRLLDPELLKGYKNLIPVIQDTLRLHDYIYVNFEKAYDQAYKGKSRLGRRRGIESRLHDKPLILPLTGLPASYVIPSGFMFPLVAAFRALISHKGQKGCHWRLDPFEFWDKYGKVLVAELMEQIDAQGGNPNVAGKRKLVYTALYSKARICMSDELEERRGK